METGKKKNIQAISAQAHDEAADNRQLEQPLIDAARGGKFDIVIQPDSVPEDTVEIGEDMSVRFSFIKGHIRTYLIRRKKIIFFCLTGL